MKDKKISFKGFICWLFLYYLLYFGLIMFRKNTGIQDYITLVVVFVISGIVGSLLYYFTNGKTFRKISYEKAMLLLIGISFINLVIFLLTAGIISYFYK